MHRVHQAARGHATFDLSERFPLMVKIPNEDWGVAPARVTDGEVGRLELGGTVSA